jgi:hypothetical protein
MEKSGQTISGKLMLSAVVAIIVAIPHAVGEERRAPAPKFSSDDTRGVFFENLAEAFRDSRPTLSAIRASANQAAQVAANGPAKSTPAAGESGSGKWDKLISPASLEDEVKRMRLHYDEVVSTPGAFNSGGYQDARLDLSALATLFAIINEHGGDVRWKDQAAAARDLLARTAFNCKAGSTQVYNEARLREQDLEALVSGSGLTGRDAEPENDWTMIVDRSPVMEYAELLTESLKGVTNSEAAMKSNTDQVKRESELLAALGLVLLQEGMDDFDDEDYAALSQQLVDAGQAVTAGLERNDYDAVRKGVGAITQSCDACHEQYR